MTLMRVIGRALAVGAATRPCHLPFGSEDLSYYQRRRLDHLPGYLRQLLTLTAQSDGHLEPEMFDYSTHLSRWPKQRRSSRSPQARCRDSNQSFPGRNPQAG